MKLMNIFGGNDKSSETFFARKKESSKAPFKGSKESFIRKEDSDEDKIHSKEFKELAITLAKKIGIEKAAEELKVSVSSIRSWQKAFDIYALAQNTTSSQSNKELNNSTDEYELSSLAQNSTAPIQDEYGVLRFSLEGRDYCFNVNSEKERELVKEEINANSSIRYDWFKEGTGEKHWVLFSTVMYEVEDIYLHYKESSLLAPVIPINATSCYAMFRDCSRILSLDLGDFNTSKVTDMQYMFSECLNLTQLDLSSFDTSKVIDMYNMFYNCKFLNTIYISNKWDISKVTFPHDTFENCRSLPNFNPTKVSTTMAKPTEEGGYLTLK